MMKTLIYLCEHENPWFNLATEDYLFQNAPDDTQVLFLWRNAPSVIIGRAQNPWLECQVAKMEKDNVMLARRQSGGGTVYHDLGNTNYTFISPIQYYSKDNNFEIIIDALAKFGITATRSGRNDILVGNKKISGSAFRETKTRAFHHGTLLINADLERLTNYLSPSRKKLVAKGVKSVRSRVMNLSEENADISHKNLCNAIIESFCNKYESTSLDSRLRGNDAMNKADDNQPTHSPDKPDSSHSRAGGNPVIKILDKKSLTKTPSLNEKYQEYQSWEWRFGRTLPFTHQLEHKFDWGLITVQLVVKRGIITDCEIYTDSLKPDEIAPLQKMLIGIKYSRDAINQECDTVSAKDFWVWLKHEIS